MGSCPPGGCCRVGSRWEGRNMGWGCFGVAPQMLHAGAAPRTPANTQDPVQDPLACGMPPCHTHGPSAPMPVTSTTHSPVKARCLYWHWPHTGLPAWCQQLPAPPAPAVGHEPRPPGRGARRKRDCRGTISCPTVGPPAGPPLRVPWARSTGSNRNRAGGGWGGGKGGPCWGRALGLSLPEVLLNSPDPSPSALATLQRRQGTKWETGIGLTVEAASTGHCRFPSKPMRAEDAQVSWVQLGHRIPSHSSHHALRGEHWGQVLMGKAGK